MKRCIATLQSVSPYSQSRNHAIEKNEKESNPEHEKRTWRERMHSTKDGEIFIPPMAFKNCVSEIAKFLSIKIPGAGKNTYTKHFEAGVLVTEPILLGIQKEDVPGEWLFLNSDGKRGGNKRVWKCMGVIHEWKADVDFLVFDDTITEEVFEHHLKQAGMFIGIGRFRVRNNGFYGRFEVLNFEWSES